MVYKNIINKSTLVSEGKVFGGEANVNVQMETGDYTFEKGAEPESWSGSGPLTYTITLTKVSGEDLSDISVVDTLPEDVIFDPTSVTIDEDVGSNNFNFVSPNVTFGSQTKLSVTDSKPLVITFQVTKPTP